MPLFSRRKPTSGSEPDVPDAISVPAPLFAPEPIIGDASPEPRDPNAPPVPGAAAASAAASASDTEAATTAEEIEADAARFRRPGSRGRQAAKRTDKRRRRGRQASSTAARPAQADQTPEPQPAAVASTPDPSRRSGPTLSAPIVVTLSLVVAVLSVLLVVLFQPGATAWAVVVALVIVGLVQLALCFVSVAVIARTTRRRLGVLALVILLLVNPLTATIVRGIASVASGESTSADGRRDADHDPIWDSYPGSAFVDDKDVLDGASYEEFGDRADTLLAEVRTALTAEFGFVWVEREAAEGKPGGNGYGGDSMLYTYAAPVWQTTSTVRTIEEKRRVVEIMRNVLLEQGIANLDLQNAPVSWREPGELTERYGGETLETQALWALNTYDVITGTGSFRASIVDLTLDSTGAVEDDRAFDVDYHGMAAEGIELHLEARALLKAADRTDFLDALKPYAGLDKPK